MAYKKKIITETSIEENIEPAAIEVEEVKEVKEVILEVKKETKIINCRTVLNIRSDASTDSDIVGKLNNGDIVEVGELKNGFYKIKNGWIMAKFVK